MHSQQKTKKKKKKRPMSRKNVLHKPVKIKHIKSQPLSDHLFNILCDKKGSNRHIKHCSSCLKKSNYASENWASCFCGTFLLGRGTRHFFHGTSFLLEMTTIKLCLFRLEYLMHIFSKMKWACHFKKNTDSICHQC